ncbi:MAG: A/G-specific adenine glycosylase [Bacteroidota bacterium]
MQHSAMKGFSEELINWYAGAKRDLPWRNTTDPYLIWLSEVILQQTRVSQGLSYYYAFAERYPSVTDLADAAEQDVLKLWQGLGYYSRARNLRHTAVLVKENYGGRFPADYYSLLKLKGIGPYTAAAVASFAQNEAVAVVDGNVYRVLARLFGIDTPIDTTAGKKQFQQLADELLGTPSSLHNQAIMEFGATVCKPKVPLCESCVFRLKCQAYKAGTIEFLPQKAKKTKVTERYFNYLVFSHEDDFYLKERQKGDVWQGLYDFPLIESDMGVEDPEFIIHHADFGDWKGFELKQRSETYVHLLSHRRIKATFWEFELKRPDTQSAFTTVNSREPIVYPLPQLIVNYLANRKRPTG